MTNIKYSDTSLLATGSTTENDAVTVQAQDTKTDAATGVEAQATVRFALDGISSLMISIFVIRNGTSKRPQREVL